MRRIYFSDHAVHRWRQRVRPCGKERAKEEMRGVLSSDGLKEHRTRDGKIRVDIPGGVKFIIDRAGKREVVVTVY